MRVAALSGSVVLFGLVLGMTTSGSSTSESTERGGVGSGELRTNGGEDGGDAQGVLGDGVRGVDGSLSSVEVTFFGDCGSSRRVDTRNNKNKVSHCR